MKKLILMSAVALSFTAPAFADSDALSAAAPERAAKKQMMKDAMDKRGARGGHGGDQGGEHKGNGLFKKHDLNGDGVVSKKEFIRAHEERFDKLDKDGNGEISRDEAKAARKARNGAKGGEDGVEGDREGKMKMHRTKMKAKKEALSRSAE